MFEGYSLRNKGNSKYSVTHRFANNQLAMPFQLNVNGNLETLALETETSKKLVSIDYDRNFPENNDKCSPDVFYNINGQIKSVVNTIGLDKVYLVCEKNKTITELPELKHYQFLNNISSHLAFYYAGYENKDIYGIPKGARLGIKCSDSNAIIDIETKEHLENQHNRLTHIQFHNLSTYDNVRPKLINIPNEKIDDIVKQLPDSDLTGTVEYKIQQFESNNTTFLLINEIIYKHVEDIPEEPVVRGNKRLFPTKIQTTTYSTIASETSQQLFHVNNWNESLDLLHNFKKNSNVEPFFIDEKNIAFFDKTHPEGIFTIDRFGKRDKLSRLLNKLFK